MTFPRMDSVWALYALQKSMMLTPCGPRAVPTGGAGVAPPAWSCTLTSAAIFFLGGIPLLLPSCGHDERRTTPCHFLLLSRLAPGVEPPSLGCGDLDRLDLKSLTELASS